MEEGDGGLSYQRGSYNVVSNIKHLCAIEKILLIMRSQRKFKSFYEHKSSFISSENFRKWH
jgi:hypothetical protein